MGSTSYINARIQKEKSRMMYHAYTKRKALVLVCLYYYSKIFLSHCGIFLRNLYFHFAKSRMIYCSLILAHIKWHLLLPALTLNILILSAPHDVYVSSIILILGRLIHFKTINRSSPFVETSYFQ